MSIDVDSGGKGGGKKSLVAEVNVIPFIDLMSCLISFLLISAVWTQLARINVSQKVPGRANTEQQPPLVKKDLKVVIDEDGYRGYLDTGPGFQQQWFVPKISQDGQQVFDLSADKGLVAKLDEWRKNPDYEDKDDIQVGATNNVKYDDVVKTMDAIVPTFADIGLTDESK